jgi:serine/threonine protein kinase
LIDWNWNVRIGDFGHSISFDSAPPKREWPSIGSHYLAPECYDNQCTPESDVFSFGLILFELVTGQPAFEKNLSQQAVAALVVVNDARPDIPESVLPAVHDLIQQCWASDPDYRPSFDQILERLEEMNFRLIEDVNSVKLSKFVRTSEQ